MKKLTLSNLCDGEMEEEFNNQYKEIISMLKEGAKGTISIQINFKKLEGTSTMYNVDFKINSRRPAAQRGGICQVNGGGELLVEEVIKAKTLELFNRKEEA